MPMDHISLMKKKAFTLLELTIVLTIIGVMITGIVVGSGLVDSAKFNAARSLTEKSPVSRIDGLVVWYETTLADSFDTNEAVDGTKITKWYDLNPTSKTSKKNVLEDKTGDVLYVKEGVNGLPALSFSSDGTVSNLELTEFDQGNSRQNTIFIVMTHRSGGGNTRWMLDSSSLSSVHTVFGYFAGSTHYIKTYFNNTQTPGISSVVPTFNNEGSYILNIYFDGVNSKGYINDPSNMVGDSEFSINSGTRELHGLTIGSPKDNSNLNRFVGLISEIIVYNRPLRTEERKDIFKYLSEKYDISVSGI